MQLAQARHLLIDFIMDLVPRLALKPAAIALTLDRPSQAPTLAIHTLMSPQADLHQPGHHQARSPVHRDLDPLQALFLGSGISIILKKEKLDHSLGRQI